MNWYLAKMVFQIIDHQPGPVRFENQIRLIQSDDEASALTKACVIGKNEQTAFSIGDRQMIQWIFINVTDIWLLSNWLDGAELFSGINEVSNAAEHINQLNICAAALGQTETRKMLKLI